MFPRWKCNAKYEASIACSYSETDLSTETEHFDHVHVHANADAPWRYHISTPLLGKVTPKMEEPYKTFGKIHFTIFLWS